ncbi:ABC transporter permease [Saezia sanguinis]|uniref:ABC transporter permease n=1 Tax=Saezia sanguinis TaxID=1965230 RepID=UPI00306B0964
MQALTNIFRLGVKELWGLLRDPVMLVLIVYCFTLAIYVAATAAPDSLSKASIAIVDEDDSPLSRQIASAFYPPMFIAPVRVTLEEVDPGMDKDSFTFALNIPPDFQRDVLRGDNPQIQLNVDATRMTQAFTGNGYIQQIVLSEITEFVQRYRSADTMSVDLTMRSRFNPNLTQSWFGSVNEVINMVTMLSIILTGAALMREREHGTIEHLLAMPVTPFQIMLSKVWSMGLVVLVATGCALVLVVRGAIHVPIEGSIGLFLVGATLHLFATTSMGIFMATVARSMAQFGMLLILVLLPMQMLSGGTTPRESMPEFVQNIMLVAPTTHFIELGQAILFRGAGIDVVWKSFLFLVVIGGVFFTVALTRFRKTITQMA